MTMAQHHGAAGDQRSRVMPCHSAPTYRHCARWRLRHSPAGALSAEGRDREPQAQRGIPGNSSELRSVWEGKASSSPTQRSGARAFYALAQRLSISLDWRFRLSRNRLLLFVGTLARQGLRRHRMPFIGGSHSGGQHSKICKMRANRLEIRMNAGNFTLPPVVLLVVLPVAASRVGSRLASRV